MVELTLFHKVLGELYDLWHIVGSLPWLPGLPIRNGPVRGPDFFGPDFGLVRASMVSTVNSKLIYQKVSNTQVSIAPIRIFLH